MESKLELLFNIKHNETKLNNLKWEQDKIDRWNRDLEKVNEIYDKLSFLNEKGIRIEKVCATQFNKQDADRGHYPFLRLPQFAATFHPIHNDKDFDFGGSANGRLDGKFNCESFILRIAKLLY